eukprot:6461567-Amphidinium_carterae.2
MQGKKLGVVSGLLKCRAEISHVSNADCSNGEFLMLASAYCRRGGRGAMSVGDPTAMEGKPVASPWQNLRGRSIG